MKLFNTEITKEILYKAIFVLSLTLLMLLGNLAYKENSGQSLPISIMLLVILTVSYYVFKSIDKKSKLKK